MQIWPQCIILQILVQKYRNTENCGSNFQKGEKDLPQNYRPVSLTCIVCKIMKKIMKFLTQNDRPVGWGGSVGSDEPPHKGH